ncbi:FliH/SctL family protein [Limnohabitans sp.]|uniref:FliH/SctL family protein n=1 Tax=Limnohabitans sp. TaxID=1907725 RepID=UPI00286EE4AB|nr:FliH/SctL family protein [Limnohabitans sp.]
MFNQPHPVRADVPWQPNASTTKKLSSRGYATTSWTSDEPTAFADLGYPAKSGGFSAAHYQPMRQPLSSQAQASLALLEGEHRNESFGEEKSPSQVGSETNAHLPFVMDSFGATRRSKLRVNVDPSVLQRALAQAELAETLVVSPITSDEKVADPIVIHPDVPDEVMVEPQPIDAAPAEPLAVVEPEVIEETPTLSAEPELPAVVGGIPAEEVAQREAEQFAKGLAQAQEEAATQLAQAVEKAMAEGLAKGLEQGKAEGLEEGQRLGLEQGLEQGKEQGLKEGEQAAREAVAEEMAAQRVLFENASNELNGLMADPKKFFEPLKRLALHIAEQVVVGELQTSSKAIERLVQRCLDELDHPVHGAVVLELNPEDKNRLETQSADFIKGMRLEAVHDMQPGSVRVFANDTVVEDLVAHRLEGLARALLVDVSEWREKSPLAQPVSETQEEVEDNDVHS